MIKTTKRLIIAALVSSVLLSLGVTPNTNVLAKSTTTKTATVSASTTKATTITKVFGTQYEDVNGDGQKEKVFFSAKLNETVYENVYVIVQSKSGKKTLAKFYMGAYANLVDNTISFADFDGDKVKEILAVNYVGGTDKSHTCGIFSIKKNKPKTIKFQPNARWSSTLKKSDDKYLVEFKASFTKKQYTIDISKNENIKMCDVYEINQDGRGPFYLAKDIDKDGKAELCVLEECDGMNHADPLAAVGICYKYDKLGKWIASDFTLESDFPLVK